MEPLICPVCETPNDPEAAHCEVCGERLTPPAPGEEIPPEENVAAMLDEAVAEPHAEEESYPESALEALSQPEDDEEPASRPLFLYSTVDGTAYEQGSPEYEDGFGPLGEELVVDPPDELSPVDVSPQELEDPTDAHSDPAAFDMDAGFEQESLDQPSSPQFKAAFEVKPKQREVLQPLPQPGTLVDPARVVVFVNREPVHTHFVETDETLIGRRDPRADAFPDLDLTDFDEASQISRKHAFIYRQNKNYTLYVVSNTGTQLNADLLELGDRRTLTDGDVIVLAGKIAMKFEIPESA